MKCAFFLCDLLRLFPGCLLVFFPLCVNRRRDTGGRFRGVPGASPLPLCGSRLYFTDISRKIAKSWQIRKSLHDFRASPRRSSRNMFFYRCCPGVAGCRSRFEEGGLYAREKMQNLRCIPGRCFALVPSSVGGVVIPLPSRFFFHYRQSPPAFKRAGLAAISLIYLISLIRFFGARKAFIYAGSPGRSCSPVR